jgi:glycine betaine/proline transport system substrate-binding protein
MKLQKERQMKGALTRREMLKMSGATLAGASLLGVAGCGSGGSGSSGNSSKTLTLGNIGWDENIAVSNLSKVLMEEDLGYKKVELKTLDVGLLFQGVAGGDLHAFQDVWMPNHEKILADIKDDVEHLDPWYQGETAFGLAVPHYMDEQSIAELNQSEAKVILGIEPGAPFVEQVKKNVIPEYDLDLELKASSTAGMFSEAERLYSREEPFVFMPWTPHWSKAEYDYHFLKDPKNAQGDFDEPAKISSIVHEDLKDEDPVAYTFINEITLDEEQLNSLENEIRKADDPIAGSKAWLEDNRDIVKPWIDAAKKAQEG